MTRFRFAFVAGAAALLPLVLSAPAQAAGAPAPAAVGARVASSGATGAVPHAPSGCSSGALCVYSGLNFTGSRSILFNCNRSWVTFGRNDVNASWFNNGTSGRWARIWQNINFNGNFDAVARGFGVSDGRTGPVFNQGSSNDWPVSPTDNPPAPSQCPG